MNTLLGCRYCLSNQLQNGVRYFTQRNNSEFVQHTKEILRRSRIKKTTVLTDDTKKFKICSAYSTGESYNLEDIKSYFTQHQRKFTVGILPKDASDVLHVKQKTEDNQQTDIFFFRRLGAFVCWNMKEQDITLLRDIIKPFEYVSYQNKIIDEEQEQLNFIDTTTDQKTLLREGDIYLNTSCTDDQQVLEKLAFSNAMALSVKLDIWEASLEEFSASLRYVPEKLVGDGPQEKGAFQDVNVKFQVLKRGFKISMTRNEVLQKIGELLTLRHQINLYSDLLITPDFYWDREDLEKLYLKMTNYLEISKRTMVINEKLNLCNELIELIRNHLNEQHGHRLEWMIIVLITIEIVFEMIHLVERYI